MLHRSDVNHTCVAGAVARGFHEVKSLAAFYTSNELPSDIGYVVVALA